jgi:hypothetical protein
MPPLDKVKDYCRYKSGHCTFVSGNAASQRKTQIKTAMPADDMLAAYYLNGNFGSSPRRQLTKTLDDPFDVEKATFCQLRFYKSGIPMRNCRRYSLVDRRTLCITAKFAHTDDQFGSNATHSYRLRDFRFAPNCGHIAASH